MAPLFMLLLVGTLEVAIMFFASSVIEGATKEAARQIRTGQIQGSADPLAAFQAELCGSLAGVIDCTEVVFTVQTFSSFSSVSMPLEHDEDGEIVNPGFFPGGSTAITVVRAVYRWNFMTPMMEGMPEDVQALREAATEAFPDAGWSIRSRDRAAPGIDRFLDRLTFLLTLVGLTALIVGGLGIANAVGAFLKRKRGTIATLKCLGASSRLVFRVYLIEVLVVATIGIALALALGAAAPFVVEGLFSDVLPVPIAAGLDALWRLADRAGITYFGTSAPFIHASIASETLSIRCATAHCFSWAASEARASAWMTATRASRPHRPSRRRERSDGIARHYHSRRRAHCHEGRGRRPCPSRGERARRW